MLIDYSPHYVDSSCALWRRLRLSGPAWMLLCVFLLAVTIPCHVHGQAGDKRQTAGQALLEMRQDLALSKEKMVALIDEVNALKKDQKALTAALVKAAAQERAASNGVVHSEDRLRLLLRQRSNLYKILQNRRAEFAEVLAMLERMGLNPPPAIFVRPDDALASVRSSVLLGAVVPEMRDKTQALAANLKELTHLTKSITQERDQLKNQLRSQAEEQKRLSLLLTEKTKLQNQSESALSNQRQKNEMLFDKAKSLEELIAELDRQERSQNNGTLQSDNILRLTAATDFDNLQGRLVYPVLGKVVQSYEKNSNKVQGETIAAAPSAIVTAPADGIVVYVGGFRSYGQLVILDVGHGYHILLAGLGHTAVREGQFVLSGEPVGAMGQQGVVSTALDVGKTAPMLYIEFRKQGKPIDPSPWWVARVSGRKQNDS